MKVIDCFCNNTYILFRTSVKSLVQKIFSDSICKEGDNFSFEFYDNDLNKRLYLLIKNRTQSLDRNNIHTYINISITDNEILLLIFLNNYLTMICDIDTKNDNWQQLLIEICNLYGKAI